MSVQDAPEEELLKPVNLKKRPVLDDNEDDINLLEKQSAKKSKKNDGTPEITQASVQKQSKLV